MCLSAFFLLFPFTEFDQFATEPNIGRYLKLITNLTITEMENMNSEQCLQIFPIPRRSLFFPGSKFVQTSQPGKKKVQRKFGIFCSLETR